MSTASSVIFRSIHVHCTQNAQFLTGLYIETLESVREKEDTPDPQTHFKYPILFSENIAVLNLKIWVTAR